ncbi:SprB repeat-containing protein [Microscilla marina]|nr:SprB repeat-containing protein [Microscilla marina]
MKRRIHLRYLLLMWLLVGISAVGQAQQYYLKVNFNTSTGCGYSQTDKYYHVKRNGNRIYPVAYRNGFAVYNQQPNQIRIYFKARKTFLFIPVKHIWYDNTWDISTCRNSTFRGRSNNCSSFKYDLIVNLFKEEKPTTSRTNYCDDTYARVTNRTCYGKYYSRYTWKIIDQDNKVYYKETSHKYLNFRLSDIYGSNVINNKYNKNIRFQVYPKGMPQLSTLASNHIRFYPKAPVISTPRVKGTTCSADLDAAISIASTTMNGNSNRFEYTLVRLIEDANGSIPYGGKRYRKSVSDKYTKQGNGGRIDFTRLGGGAYWLLNVNSAGSLSACQPATKIIHIPLVPVFNIASVAPANEYTAVDGRKYQIARHDGQGNIRVKVSGGKAPYRYSINGGRTYSSATNQATREIAVPAGTYHIKVKTATGCEKTWTRSVKMTQPDPLQKALLASTDPLCTDNANGSITFEFKGGITPYTVKLMGATNKTETFNTAGSHTISGLLPGKYTYQLKDAPNAYLAVANAANLLNPAALQIALVDQKDLLCNGGNNGRLEVKASGGKAPYIYKWSVPNGENTKAENLTAGKYTVIITDQNGCTLSQSYTLSEPTPLQVTQVIGGSKDPTCYNGNDGQLMAQASGGAGNYTYIWAGATGKPQQGAMVSGLTAGTYTLKVIDGNQCEVTTTYTLDNPRELKSDLGEDVTICKGQSVTLDAGNPGAKYHWASADGSFVSHTQKVTLAKAGEYTLTITNQKGQCAHTERLVVTESDNLLEADFLMDEEVAVNTSVSAIEASIIQAVGQDLPDRLKWEVVPNDKGNQPTMQKDESHYEQVFTFPATGTYTIRLYAWLGGCYSVVEKTITVKDYQKPEEQLAGGGNSEESNIKVYKLFPNPNNGKFSFNIELKKPTDIKAKIYDGYNWQEVTKQEGKATKNHTFSFDAAGKLSQGVHYLIVDTPQERKMIRFVVF